MSPSKAIIPECGLVGTRYELEGAMTADMVSGEGAPMVLAIIPRPRREPLDLEGSEPLPVHRSLYLFRLGDNGEVGVTHLLDDPGPVRDQFGRRSYERLAAVRGVCDDSGCLVAALVERLTPEIEGAAVMSYVLSLDAGGEVQGPPRRLAQEPDRGNGQELPRACLGVSSAGFLLATAVLGGRGRLLWLDRRATPLDMQYVATGFDSCSVAPSGLRLDVATGSASGVEIIHMGRAASEEEPADWSPELPSEARLPRLLSLGAEQLLAWADGSGVYLLSSTRSEPVEGLDHRASGLDVMVHDNDLVVAAIGAGELAAARLNKELEVTARSSSLIEIAGGQKTKESPKVWVLSTGAEGWLGWKSDEKTFLQKLACPLGSDGEPAKAETARLASSDVLAKADRGAVRRILELANTARRLDQNYRAAWLLERAYHLAPADPQPMVDAAALLTEIRYTKSSLRMLERLSDLDRPEARKALRSACNDRKFERLWSAGDFQRFTGCRAPSAPAADAGDESGESNESNEQASGEQAAGEE